MNHKSKFGLQKQHFHIDQFEDRIVMTANPLGEMAVVPEIVMPHLAQQGDLIQFSNDQFNLNDLRAQYGLDGKGQTVAVIDSGIAWDHYALGAGFGSGNKVVGGWDFAENDANPYDDGPAGFHGTHVSGIVASTDSTYTGVAPGADLVGLRVFTDQGQGKIEWVEQALQWVHDHKESFANPITTVNLSLGTAWNNQTVPNWATLEDELAQLKADGIFISVAAGNAFAQYNTTGLSYPAVSPSVVPVASENADGSMSGFSQRDSRVLVAPGENIRSTVPDHLFSGMKTGQFLGASGTSMAAPYVAGASVLLREAYEFMGEENIDQTKLYNTFLANADKKFDAVTGGWYSHLNLDKAIAAVMHDDYGNTWNNTTNIGSLATSTSIAGTITTIDDVDTFSFTASQSGRVTLAFETTHSLQAVVKLAGDNMQTDGNQVSFDVVAGTQYKFSVATADGTGHYHMGVGLQANSHATQVGPANYQVLNGQNISGEKLYAINAERSGILTVLGTNANSNMQVLVLNSNQNVIANATMANGQLRVDCNIKDGETCFIKVIGNGSVDLTMLNLVSLKNGVLDVVGTNGNDQISLDKSNGVKVSINSIEYQFESSQVRVININGNGGTDFLSTTLGSGDDAVTINRDSFQAKGSGYQINASGFRSTAVWSGGGSDRLTLNGSTESDTVTQVGSLTTMKGSNFNSFARGFNQQYIFGGGGYDSISLTGSSGNDRFWDREGRSFAASNKQVIISEGFSNVTFDGNGGNDRANLFDTAGDDSFVLSAGGAIANLSNRSVSISDVVRINAIASQGNDSVRFTDSQDDDTFSQTGNSASFWSTGMKNVATGFDIIQVQSTSGQDLANLKDSTGNDQVWMYQGQTSISNSEFSVVAKGFQRVNVVATSGGNDSVNMYGTKGNDLVYSDSDSVSLATAAGKVLRAVGFEAFHVDGLGGVDSAAMFGKVGYERFVTNNTGSALNFGNRSITLLDFENTQFDGIDNVGEIVFADFSEGDTLIGDDNRITGVRGSTTVLAKNFGMLEASTKQGQSAEYEIGLVDYLFMLDGNWSAR